MKEFEAKLPYAAPKIKVVTFKVEMGVTESGMIEYHNPAERDAFDMVFYQQQMQQGVNGHFSGAQFNGGSQMNGSTWLNGYGDEGYF